MKNFIQNISITEQVAEYASIIKCPDLFMPLIRVGPGRFLCGCTQGHTWSQPEHLVVLTKPFWICKQEVTQTEYMEVMGRNPSFHFGAAHPVDSVTWFEAAEFCQRITERSRSCNCMTDRLLFRLPTEAEWEYACRINPEDPGFQPEDSEQEPVPGPAYCYGSNPHELGNYAWFCQNSEDRSHPAGSKSASPRGLYDLHGNVAEWCTDWFAPYAHGTETNPQGPAEGLEKVLRGGSWGSTASRCRSYERIGAAPHTRSGLIGFRVVLAETQ